MKKTLPLFIAVLFVTVGVQVTQAVSVGQLDDFQDGTTMNWLEGDVSPNPPVNLPDGGPGGVGDHAVRNEATGVNGAGGKMAMFNSSQWTGDYLAAGINQLDIMMRADPSGESLLMRVAVEGNAGGRYASAEAFELPNDGQWYAASFLLDEASLVLAGGSDSLNDVLGSVVQLRILHNQMAAWQGSNAAATLDVDNIVAVPEPASGWALLAVLGLWWLRRV